MACSSNAQLFLIFKTVSRISVTLLHPKLLMIYWRFDEKALHHFYLPLAMDKNVLYDLFVGPPPLGF
jgi:hypothetical protein